MATAAANFYLTSEAQPSIFEIIAQHNLNSTLQPALEKLALFLSNCNKKYLHWTVQHYDETFLVVNGLLQLYYLRKHDASFAEHFYGLRRQRVDGYEVSTLQKHFSWFYLVIVPYFYKKFKGKVADYQILEADQLLLDDPYRNIKKALVYLHNGIEITWGSWILVNYIRYMSNKADSQLPSLQLLNLKLIYATNEDDQHFWASLIKGELSLGDIGAGLVKNTVQSLLEISAFFVQFLQAWNSERMNFSMTSLPVVRAPPEDVKSKNYKGKCPICLLRWKMPTVVPISGYVFCMSCIYNHLRETGKCPVTQLPCKPLDIIRLYQ